MAFFRKDASLDQLAKSYNVAQFISFAPEGTLPVQQYSRVRNYDANHKFFDLKEAITELLRFSANQSLNIRSFTPTETQSREFLYGLTDELEIYTNIMRLTESGAHTILNETIDVSDGGVSGVILGNIVEFRPDATPRGVERPGFASLPISWAKRLFKFVYGIEVDFPEKELARVEFSIHPRRTGWLNSHTIYWEYEELHTDGAHQLALSWPNDFSRMIGDKAFGLLIASLVGVPVPRTTVISRRVAPFSFGSATDTGDIWIRTSPKEQVPGKYTTHFGWVDPFALLAQEDPIHQEISSVLSQDSVGALWSGATLEGGDGDLLIEGVRGYGDRFMQGDLPPQVLPDDVLLAVKKTARQLSQNLGAVRFEWAFDGDKVWVLQLHLGRSSSTSRIIVPGDATQWREFDVSLGLDAMRNLLERLRNGEGLLLSGRVGLTSHIADVLRKARIPARVQSNDD